jgi:hypothetical protein
MSGVALQQDCDPNDPKQHLLWTYVGLPLRHGHHAVNITDPSVLMEWSQQQYDAGVRHVPELQRKRYIPPALGHTAFGPVGTWEKVDDAARVEQERRGEADAAIAKMSAQVLRQVPDLGKLAALPEHEKKSAREATRESLKAQMAQMAALLDELGDDK